ncbi:MAG: elongation factor 1-beta [Candidatus Nanoarchaeia archaeon]
MADAIITLKIMPESTETDLGALADAATEKIKAFGGEVGKKEEQPVAFGLKAVVLTFVMDEQLGSTETLENQISELKEVTSVDVTDVRRALG